MQRWSMVDAATAHADMPECRDDCGRRETSRESEPWRTRAWALFGHVGVNAPLGILGASFDVAPVSFFALSAGAGVSTDGMQLAAMPRLRLPFTGTKALTFGVGVSEGKYSTSNRTGIISFDPYWEKTWPTAWRINAEVGVESIALSGYTWRLFAGVRRMTNPDSYVCGGSAGFTLVATPSPPCPRDVGATTAYAGAAFGYAF